MDDSLEEETSIDFRFDIDALFAHLIGELEHDLEDELDWSFALRSKDVPLPFAKVEINTMVPATAKTITTGMNLPLIKLIITSRIVFISNYTYFLDQSEVHV